MIQDPDGRPYRHLSLPDLIYLDLLTPYIHWKNYIYPASPPKKNNNILFPKSLDQNRPTLLRNTKNQWSTRSQTLHFPVLFLSQFLFQRKDLSSGRLPKEKHVAAVSPIKIKMDFETLQAADATHTRLHCNRFLDSGSTWWFFSA